MRRAWTDLAARGTTGEAAVRIGSEYRVDMPTLAARLEELELADGEQLAVVRHTSTTRADIIEHDLVVSHPDPACRGHRALPGPHQPDRNGTATSLETLRAYVTGLGGHLDIVARIGNIHLNVA